MGEEKCDEVVIGDISFSNIKKLANKCVLNNIDKIYKEKKVLIKETGIFIDFHIEEITNMDENK